MTLRGFAFWTALAVLLGLVPKRVEAQPPRWPDPPPTSQSYPARTASHVSSITALPPVLKPADSENPDRPPDARDGVFQKLIFSSTWLDAGTRNGFGMVDLELQSVLAFPIPSRQSPIAVTPAFAVHYLDGPVVSDLPPRVYDAAVQFRWWKRLTPHFGLDLKVAPGVFSDFQQSTDEAIRIPGHVIGILDCAPNAKLLFGVAYLDREDVPVLPVGGLLWYPHPDLKIELAVPRPRIARRIYWQGAFTDDVQDWAYVAGEFGGGTWAIRRDHGANDLFTYRDYRLILGLERTVIGGLDANLELGYVFSRAIEYSGGSPDVNPSDTVMLRLGFTY